MSTEENHIRNNNLKDVYDKKPSLPLIKTAPSSKINQKEKEKEKEKDKENFQTDQEYNVDIGNKVFDLNRNRKSYNIQTSLIDNNSKHIENDIIQYNTYNDLLKKVKYETIDSEGNLLFNNIDIEPTKLDAMMEDSLGNKLQQNNFFIAGTVIITSLFFGIIAVSL